MKTKNKTMNQANNALVLAGALIGLVGCATPTKLAVLEPIGPSPAVTSVSGGDGYLQVYSAQKMAGVDANMEEWRWNNDYGRNAFEYEPAHTDYTIYGQAGGVIEQVRNSRDPADGTPTLVPLPPGRYEIQAEARDASGTVEVKVPVVVQVGKTTRAHLEGGWKPRHRYSDNEVVRLPDGEIAGWLAVR